MDRNEVKNLLKDIKVCYPRFDAVEKVEAAFRYNPEVIDAWHRRIGWMDYDRAIRILDQYMESEEGSRTPSISLWMRNGKAQARGSDYCSASLDRQHGVIRWQPEPNGTIFELQTRWDASLGAWIDNEGQLWGVPGE